MSNGIHFGIAGDGAKHISRPRDEDIRTQDAAAAVPVETTYDENVSEPTFARLGALGAWLDSQDWGEDACPDVDAIAAKIAEGKMTGEVRAGTEEIKAALRAMGASQAEIEAAIGDDCELPGNPVEEAKFELLSLFAVIRMYLKFAAQQTRVNAEVESQHIDSSMSMMYARAEKDKAANKDEHEAGMTDVWSQKIQGILGGVLSLAVGGYGYKKGGLEKAIEMLPIGQQVSGLVSNGVTAHYHQQKIHYEQVSKDTRVDSTNLSQMGDSFGRSHEKSRQQGMTTTDKMVNAAETVARKNDEIRSII